MEKKVTFRSAWLPWALLAPQAVVILVFFYWPAAQSLIQSFQQQDAFGTSVQWVGLENFRNLFGDETYLGSFRVTAEFSILVVTGGSGAIRTDGGALELRRGETALLPYGAGEARIEGDLFAIRCRPPITSP